MASKHARPRAAELTRPPIRLTAARSAESAAQMIADPQGVGDGGERGVHRADADEETGVDDVEVVEFVRLAVAVEHGGRGIVAEPAARSGLPLLAKAAEGKPSADLGSASPRPAELPLCCHGATSSLREESSRCVECGLCRHFGKRARRDSNSRPSVP